MFFFMTSAFYFLIIVTTLAWTFRMIFLCTSDDLTRIFVLIGGPTYTFQYLLLFYILFYRIILVFKGTAYGLQKRTIMVLSSGNRDSVLGPISQAVSSFAALPQWFF
eukprot:463734_1